MMSSPRDGKKWMVITGNYPKHATVQMMGPILVYLESMLCIFAFFNISVFFICFIFLVFDDVGIDVQKSCALVLGHGLSRLSWSWGVLFSHRTRSKLD